MQTEEKIHFKFKGYKDMNAFANDIMSYQVKKLDKKCLHYNINK